MPNEPTDPRNVPHALTREAPKLVVLAADAEHGWMMVDKPAGWHSVTLARSDGSPTVEQVLRRDHPELEAIPEAGLVHRLDQGTSGCVLVGTSTASRERLRSAMKDGSIRKIYLAGIDGDLPSVGEFRLYFTSRHRRSAKVTVRREGSGVEEGRCRWRRVPGEDRLLEVELLGPGRRHQIRAGLASLGAPLRGDELYGGRAASRLALHAWRLHLDGRLIESPRPDGM